MCIMHPPAECKLTMSKLKKTFMNKRTMKKQGFKAKMKAYLQAKAAYCACMNETTNKKKLVAQMMKIPMFHYQHILQKQAMFLDMKRMRNGDQYYLM